jgi:hypothetical protein
MMIPPFLIYCSKRELQPNVRSCQAILAFALSDMRRLVYVTSGLVAETSGKEAAAKEHHCNEGTAGTDRLSNCGVRWRSRLDVSDPDVWHDSCPDSEQMQKLAPPHQWIKPFPGG